MSVFWTAGIIYMFLCVQSALSDLPADIQKCHYGDSKCLVSTIQSVVRKYSKSGIREVNLIPFQPLHIKLLKLDKNPSSPVSLDLKFKEIDLFGLLDAKISRVKGFTANLQEPTEVEAVIPKLILKGPYEIDGRVLILPIVGKGDSEIQLENTHIHIKLTSKAVEKNGQTYLGVENLRLSIQPKKVSFKFTGLFNNNKELGDNMLVFINENWSEIFTELQPDLARALSLIIKQILENVFSKMPYEKYFLPN